MLEDLIEMGAHKPVPDLAPIGTKATSMTSIPDFYVHTPGETQLFPGPGFASNSLCDLAPYFREDSDKVKAVQKTTV